MRSERSEKEKSKMNFTKKEEEAMARIKSISFEDAASAATQTRRQEPHPLAQVRGWPAAVAVRGDELTRPIYWLGRQWAVTAYGVEARDGTYPIERSRVDEATGDYTWERHLWGKVWVDQRDFAAAMRIARWVFADKKAEHALARLGELQGDLF